MSYLEGQQGYLKFKVSFWMAELSALVLSQDGMVPWWEFYQNP